jgi:siroheme synthase-like protein
MPPGYPIVLRPAGWPCLVVGGGHVALRKIGSLLESGASITVVAPQVIEAICELDVVIVRRKYLPGDLEGMRLAISATGDPEVDGAVYADGERSGVLVNAADDPEHCAFTLPALVRHGVVTVAVSTDGATPAFATWLRDRFAAALTDDLGELIELVAGARTTIRAQGVGTEGLGWYGLIADLEAARASSSTEAQRVRDAFVATVIEDSRRPKEELGGTVGE